MPKSKIDSVLAAINKGSKVPIARTLKHGVRSDITTVIPTGIESVDRWVLGCGGLPAGRVVELFADEGVGKTSLMLAALAGVQRMGGIGILAETEVALQSKRAEVFGVDLENLIILEPAHLTELMQQLERVLKALPKKTPSLFAWDSVAATPSREEYEEGIPEKQGMDRRARAISQGMRILGPLTAEKQCSQLWINQIRAKIGVMFGANTTTPGGYAPKFHASIRLCMYSGKSIKGPHGHHLGKILSVQAVKNKLVPPWRKAYLRLNFANGWDNDWAVLRHAKEMKLVPPRSRSVTDAREALEASQWGPKTITNETEDEFEEDV